MITTPSAAPAAGQTDVRDMFVVHAGFRREFRLASGLVRAVATGDTARARDVGEHLDLMVVLLQHHHTNEDQKLWPLLHERVPSQLEPIVDLMERHHAALHDVLARLSIRTTAWTAGAGDMELEALAELLDRLHVVLEEHLSAEESRLLPIAAEYVTQAEWDDLGSGSLPIPFRQQLLVAGSLLYSGDPEVVALMLSKAPWLARVLIPRLGRRAFARRARQLYGTATP